MVIITWKMMLTGCLLINILQICQAQSADSYDVKSPGVVLGIVLGATSVIAVTIIIIIIVVCVKKNLRKDKRIRRPALFTHRRKKQNRIAILEQRARRLQKIIEGEEEKGEEENISSRVSIRDEFRLTSHEIVTEGKSSDINERISELAEVHQKHRKTSISSIDQDKKLIKAEESTTSTINRAETSPFSDSNYKEFTTPMIKRRKLSSSEDIGKELLTSPTEQKENRSSNEDIGKNVATSQTKQEEKISSNEDNGPQLPTSQNKQEETRSSNEDNGLHLTTSQNKQEEKRSSNEDNGLQLTTSQTKQEEKQSSNEGNGQELTTSLTQQEKKRSSNEYIGHELTTTQIKQEGKQSSNEENFQELSTNQTKQGEKRSSNEDNVNELSTSQIKQGEKRSSSDDIIHEITTSQEEEIIWQSSEQIVRELNTSPNKQDETWASIEDTCGRSKCEEDEAISDNKNEALTKLTLRKDLPFFKSKEHVFTKYDPAMTYKAEDNRNASKSEEGLNFTFTKCAQIDIPPNVFEFTRDDSDLYLKYERALEAEKLVQIKKTGISEGILTDDHKFKSLKRRSSLISRITIKPIEWKFDYASPYALTDQQKRERSALKQRLKQRKLHAQRKKQSERNRKEYENYLAFEKWKRRKHDEIIRGDVGSFKTRKSNRYREWYP